MAERQRLLIQRRCRGHLESPLPTRLTLSLLPILLLLNMSPIAPWPPTTASAAILRSAAGAAANWHYGADPAASWHAVRGRSARSKQTRKDSFLQYLYKNEISRKEAPSSGRAPKKAASPPIKFHGGGVIAGPIIVYLIYYGNWSQGASDVLETFVHSLSNTSSTPSGPGINRASDWWKIVMNYPSSKGKGPGKVVFGGRSFDNYSQGADLTGNVGTVVYNALKKKKFKARKNAVYMVLPSADVTETPDTGFCAGTYPFTSPNPIGYCGWHWYFTYPKLGNLAYAFIGNADQCVRRCGHILDIVPNCCSSTPNGDVGIDAMVNTLAHELAEAVTDMDAAHGWFTDGGLENGDICNRKWGKVTMSEDGSYVYNMLGQGGMRWLVQLMWDRTSSTCRMQLPSTSKQK